MADLRWIFKAWCDLNQSELDSQADTCVASANAHTRVLDYTDTKVSVSPFSDSYEAIKDVPIATTWCFALEWATEIWQHTVHDIAALNEQTLFEHYTGHTPNIAALCTYSFYD
jgi:hypothetical protein